MPAQKDNKQRRNNKKKLKSILNQKTKTMKTSYYFLRRFCPMYRVNRIKGYKLDISFSHLSHRKTGKIERFPSMNNLTVTSDCKWAKTHSSLYIVRRKYINCALARGRSEWTNTNKNSNKYPYVLTKTILRYMYKSTGCPTPWFQPYGRG